MASSFSFVSTANTTFVALFGNVHGGSFTEAQVQIVLLTDAVTNGSTWAIPLKK